MLIWALLLLGQDTTCQTFGTITRCRTTPAPSSGTPPVRYDQPQRLDGEALSRIGSGLRAKRERSRTRKVGKLIAEGRCDEARAYALQKGDFYLVREAESACQN